MAAQRLGARVGALDAELARVERRREREPVPPRPSWNEIGIFENARIFEEPMKLERPVKKLPPLDGL